MIGLSPHELHLAHYSTQKIGQYSIAPKKTGTPYRNFYKGSSGKFLLGFDASQLYRALLTICNNIYETQRCIGNAIDGRIYSPIMLGMFLTPVCLCSPSSISWYRPKGGDALRLGSKGRYGVCVGGR